MLRRIFILCVFLTFVFGISAANAMTDTAPVTKTATSTVTIAALLAIHIDSKDRDSIEVTAKDATKNLGKLRTDSTVATLMDARAHAENVCRTYSDILTRKIRRIEGGSSWLGLMSVLATGAGLATKVINSAKGAALIAGGTKAYEDAFDKADSEHGIDRLRAARVELAGIRRARLKEAEAAFVALEEMRYDTNGKPLPEPQLKEYIRAYQAPLATMIAECQG